MPNERSPVHTLRWSGLVHRDDSRILFAIVPDGLACEANAGTLVFDCCASDRSTLIRLGEMFDLARSAAPSSTSQVK